MKRVKIGVTGNGVAKRLHEPILSEFSCVDVKKIFIPEHSKNIDAVTELESLDLLIIGTPTYNHVNHILFASLYCSKILCEKPVGVNLIDLENLNRTLKTQKKKVFVNYQLRFLPHISKLLSFTQNNKVDKLVIEYKSGARKSTSTPNWYHQPNKGGGVIYSVLPHILDLIIFLGFSFQQINYVSSKSKYEFISSSQDKYVCPMDDVSISFKCLPETIIDIHINTKEEYDCFNLVLEVESKSITYDIISGIVGSSNSLFHPLGSLSSQNSSIWRVGFRKLIENLLSQIQELPFQDVIPTTESSLDIQKAILNILTHTLNSK